MSGTEDKDKKSQASVKVDLDAALRAWPEASGDDADAKAQALVTRLEEGERGATVDAISDDDLFAPPLARVGDDGDAVAPSVRAPRSERGPDRERDCQSLRDLAKLAPALSSASTPIARPVEAKEGKEGKKDDSGIIDLAAAAKADPDAAERAKVTPVASVDLFAEAPPASRPSSSSPASARSPNADDAPPSAAPAVAIRESKAPPAERRHHDAETRGRVTWLFGGIASLGAAAAIILLMRAPANAPPPLALSVSPSPAASATATEAPSAPTAPTPPASAAAPPGTVAAADPNTLPSAVPDERLALAAKPSKAGAGKSAAEPGAKPAAPAKLAEKDLASSTNGSGDLGNAMKKEVGDDGSDKLPAAALSGSGMNGVPQHPSPGAIAGALGAVLPQARTCLGPDDPISRATIVFGSNGSVQSVSIAGAAAGKPTEQCIKDALGKAKVPPFAEPSFPATIKVRHD